MGMSTHIHNYKDVKEVLDAAVAQGGARYKLETDKQAIRWRLRAYQYRKLLQKQMSEGVLIPGYTPETPYDGMLLTLDGPTVVIQFGLVRGTLTDLDGNPIVPPKEATTDEDDPLLLEALRLVDGVDE